MSVCAAASITAIGCTRTEAVPAPPIRIAAASDLAQAFEEIAQRFEAETKQRVSLSFGSTGLFAKQIREGAPFDVFAAANETFVDQVVRSGACDGSTKAGYARGRVAIWSPKLAKAPGNILELAEPKYTRIAIANPEHAPYGQAAKEALISAGIWQVVEPKIVYAENVRQARQFADTGNVEAALVAFSLVALEAKQGFSLIEETKHRPIQQALVVCRNGKREIWGQRFADFVNSETGRKILSRYGLSAE